MDYRWSIEFDVLTLVMEVYWRYRYETGSTREQIFYKTVVEVRRIFKTSLVGTKRKRRRSSDWSEEKRLVGVVG